MRTINITCVLAQQAILNPDDSIAAMSTIGYDAETALQNSYITRLSLFQRTIFKN